MGYKNKVNTDEFQQGLQKKYYSLSKELLKAQYFGTDNISLPLQTISALEGFVTYLRYLRDTMFLQELGYDDYKASEFKGSIALNLLTVTISEYEKSQTCISKYFDIDFDKIADKNIENIITPKNISDDNESTFDAAQNAYVAE